MPILLPNIRVAALSDLSRLDWIARKYIEELGFLPRVQLRSAIEASELLMDERTGAFVKYHQRRDGWKVIYSVVVPINARSRGIGRALVEAVGYPQRLKCPDGLPSNMFYLRCGYRMVKREWSKVRILNVWEKVE